MVVAVLLRLSDAVPIGLASLRSCGSRRGVLPDGDDVGNAMDGDEDFYFSEWCFLAQVDPAAFERRRARLIDSFLKRSGKHRPHLESLQAVIDTERERAPTPVDAMLMISSKLCGSLCLLEEELKELSEDLHKLSRMKITCPEFQSRWAHIPPQPRRYVRPTARVLR